MLGAGLGRWLVLKRLLDVCLAAVALALSAPLLALGAVGIRLSSPGPILYPARRVGLGGRPFTMYKLRTMHVRRDAGDSVITAAADPRVFRFGGWLRRTKIDELPQLVNVLRGEMSIVGPRPEDPAIVAAHYGPLQWETLRVRPGLSSPGSVYGYTHGEHMIGAGRSEADYVERVLEFKVALDAAYVRRASLAYDLAVVARTLLVIASTMAGRRRFPMPPETEAARRLLREHPARR
jgi:lipopolysaccharide/colanic/teichoic acid biosynthesis glycosyltransferase